MKHFLEGKVIIFSIYRLHSLSFKGDYKRGARYGARSCEGNLKVVNTKTLCTVLHSV